MGKTEEVPGHLDLIERTNDSKAVKVEFKSLCRKFCLPHFMALEKARSKSRLFDDLAKITCAFNFVKQDS